VKERVLHKNISLNIFECAEKSILAKSNIFFLLDIYLSHPMSIPLSYLKKPVKSFKRKTSKRIKYSWSTEK